MGLTQTKGPENISVEDRLKTLEEEIKKGRTEIKEMMDARVKEDPTLRDKARNDLREYDQEMEELLRETAKSLTEAQQIQQNLNQRIREREKDPRRVQSLMWTLSYKQEEYYLDNNTYFSCENEGCETIANQKRERASHDIKVVGNANTFRIWGRDKEAPNRVFLWDQASGSMQELTASSWPD
jgi:chromosome segregation ATPase